MTPSTRRLGRCVVERRPRNLSHLRVGSGNIPHTGWRRRAEPGNRDGIRRRPRHLLPVVRRGCSSPIGLGRAGELRDRHRLAWRFWASRFRNGTYSVLGCRCKKGCNGKPRRPVDGCDGTGLTIAAEANGVLSGRIVAELSAPVEAGREAPRRSSLAEYIVRIEPLEPNTTWGTHRRAPPIAMEPLSFGRHARATMSSGASFPTTACT